MPDQHVYIITKRPPEQYSISKSKNKEIREKNKPRSDYENAITVFDENLSKSNSKYNELFFKRGRHNNLNIYYLSPPYFDLPKRTIPNKSYKNVMFNQTSKDIENIYRHVGGYDMKYDLFKELCRKSWEDEYNYLRIDRSKKSYQGRYFNCNESKNTYIECTPETAPF